MPTFVPRSISVTPFAASSHTRKRAYTRMPVRRSEMKEIVGALLPGVANGATGATMSLGDERRVVEPFAFFAVTSTRNVPYVSARRTPYVFPVAPRISMHEPPNRPHWYHW